MISKPILVLVFTCLFVGHSGAQMWERGKKNFFVEPEGSVNFSNYKKSAYTGNKYGMSFGLSGGKIFSGFIKTGLVYRYNQHSIGTWDSVALTHSTVPRQYAGAKAELMFPFLRFNLGKSNRYECKTLTNFLALGPEFGFNFGATNTRYTINSTEFMLNASWLFLIKNSGSNKKQAANDVYFSINMKHGQTPFSQRAGGGQKFYSTYWGVSILWVKYKTGNWLR